MESVTVYHNPACSKSRGALEILNARGVACDIVEYLKHHPDRDTLARIIRLLSGPPAELVRKDERFAELGLHAQSYTSADEVIDLLLEHPELMERPVVMRGERAIIARPSERVLELFD
jgi:arsenate reductase